MATFIKAREEKRVVDFKGETRMVARTHIQVNSEAVGSAGVSDGEVYTPITYSDIRRLKEKFEVSGGWSVLL